MQEAILCCSTITVSYRKFLKSHRLFPLSVKVGTIPKKFVIPVHEDLNRLCCDEDRSCQMVEYFIFENDFCRLRRFVGYPDGRCHPISERMTVVDVHPDNRSEYHIVDIGVIRQSIFCPECLTGILKIKGIGTMPYNLHHIHFTEADFELLFHRQY